MDSKGKYMLDQGWVLSILSNHWGASGVGSVQIKHNDRVRVYGIVMSLEENRERFQRLAEVCQKRRHLDDPSFSLKKNSDNSIFDQ